MQLFINGGFYIPGEFYVRSTSSNGCSDCSLNLLTKFNVYNCILYKYPQLHNICTNSLSNFQKAHETF